LPELNTIKGQQSVRPAVQIFEGVKCVISLYELMLKTSKKQSAFLTIEKIPKELKSYLTKTFINHKIKYKVKSRVLITYSKSVKLYQCLDKKFYREIKIISKNALSFETEIIIGQQEIAVIDLSSSFFGVLIKSSTIRNTMASLFEIIWGFIK